jgi:hypothetical protein
MLNPEYNRREPNLLPLFHVNGASSAYKIISAELATSTRCQKASLREFAPAQSATPGEARAHILFANPQPHPDDLRIQKLKSSLRKNFRNS